MLTDQVFRFLVTECQSGQRSAFATDIPTRSTFTSQLLFSQQATVINASEILNGYSDPGARIKLINQTTSAGANLHEWGVSLISIWIVGWAILNRSCNASTTALRNASLG